MYSGYDYNTLMNPWDVYGRYGKSSARLYREMMYAQQATAPQVSPTPKHTCSVKQVEDLKGYQSGIVDFHRRAKRVNVSKLEEECKVPACVLSRIKKP